MVASSCPQNFQNLYSSIPEPPKEKSLWEKTMEFMQETEHMMQNYENFTFQSSNRFESKQSQLANFYRNEETLSYQSLANSDIFNFTDMTKELCHFGNQASISSYQPELDQN